MATWKRASCSALGAETTTGKVFQLGWQCIRQSRPVQSSPPSSGPPGIISVARQVSPNIRTDAFHAYFCLIYAFIRLSYAYDSSNHNKRRCVLSEIFSGPTRPPEYLMRRAFTLIELLAVVAIIALVIAILLPAFNKARESTKDVVCRANIGSVGKAQLSYAADNRGHYTISTEWVWGKNKYPDKSNVPIGPGGVGQQLDPTVVKNVKVGKLYPYHGVLEAFVCPVAMEKLPRQSWWTNQTMVRSYVQNGEAGMAAEKEWSDKGWTEEERGATLKSPSNFAVFVEENTFAIQGWNTFNGMGMNDALFRLQPFDYDILGSFHNTNPILSPPVNGTYYSPNDPLSSGQSHLFLADGHVEPARYKGRIVGGTWNNASWSRMWCKDEIPVQR